MRYNSLQELRFISFTIMVLAVYVLALWLLISTQLRKKQVPSPPISKIRLWFGRSVYTIAVIGIGCMLYGYFIEPYWLAITPIKLTSHKLPKGSPPLRIVHFSDLHSDAKPRLEGTLPTVIAAQKPDLILFTGDTINSPAGLPVARALLGKLAKIAPTYVVRGNWDIWHWGAIDLFGGTGVTELQGEPLKLELKGQPVWLMGVPVSKEAQFPKLALIPKEDLTIMLYHYPDEIENPNINNIVDLYCAGHTHGGQVALPFYGALLTYSRFDKKYESGLHKVNNTYLYVNRGIGMEGGSAVRVRFCARPELTVIDITSE